MEMFKPPHPGEIIREDCLKTLKLSVTEAAKGDEASSWAGVNGDPIPIALELWRRSRASRAHAITV